MTGPWQSNPESWQVGARPTDVVSMVMSRASLLVAAGLLIGGVAAWYLSAGGTAPRRASIR